MAEEYIEEEQETGGFRNWLKGLFSKKEEGEEEESPKYKRRLLDGRIEKYLDQNMDAYVQEYGIVTGLDLEAYEIRYGELTGRVSKMKEYMVDADAHLSAMEKDLDDVQKASKKK